MINTTNELLLMPERTKVDVLGDVHGCVNELRGLLQKLGYILDSERVVMHPEVRLAILVGDLTDRGTDSLEVLKFVMNSYHAGTLVSVRGNHDDKLLRALQGNQIHASKELIETMTSIQSESDEWKKQMIAYLENMPFQLGLDHEKLIVAHGGMPEKYQLVTSAGMRKCALYGMPTGKTDDDGRPIRIDWGATYEGSRFVVYGHTPITVPKWVNNTINIDTGCFKTGVLTAVRYPEMDLVSYSQV